MTEIIDLKKPVWEFKVPEGASQFGIKMFSFHPGAKSQSIVMESKEIGIVLSAIAQAHSGITVPCDLIYPLPPDCKSLCFHVMDLCGEKTKEGKLIVHYLFDDVQEEVDDPDYFKVEETKEAKDNGASKNKRR